MITSVCAVWHCCGLPSRRRALSRALLDDEPEVCRLWLRSSAPPSRAGAACVGRLGAGAGGIATVEAGGDGAVAAASDPAAGATLDGRSAVGLGWRSRHHPQGWAGTSGGPKGKHCSQGGCGHLSIFKPKIELILGRFDRRGGGLGDQNNFLRVPRRPALHDSLQGKYVRLTLPGHRDTSVAKVAVRTRAVCWTKRFRTRGVRWTKRSQAGTVPRAMRSEQGRGSSLGTGWVGGW